VSAALMRLSTDAAALGTGGSAGGGDGTRKEADPARRIEHVGAACRLRSRGFTNTSARRCQPDGGGDPSRWAEEHPWNRNGAC